jgi:hypothetical protein
MCWTQALADGVREGWLTPASRVGVGPPPRKPVAAFRDLIEELRRDRDDRSPPESP